MASAYTGLVTDVDYDRFLNVRRLADLGPVALLQAADEVVDVGDAGRPLGRKWTRLTTLERSRLALGTAA